MLFVSDIHFGANRDEDVASFVSDALNPDINPDRLVIIVGDITQNATKDEFKAAETFILQLLDGGMKLVFTPGNHDFGNWMAEYLKVNNKARAWCRNLLSPIFKQDEVVAVNDYDAIFKFQENIFVTLRSTHRGELEKLGLLGNNRISKKQISWAASVLSDLDAKGCKLHLVTHRSIWRESGDMHHGMGKRGRLEKMLLKPFRFHSFIHGHNHRFVYSQTSTPRMAMPIIRLAVPTLSMRNKNWQPGYVSWEKNCNVPPKLISRNHI
ncbi:MAG: metallophosphoesterase [Thermodesulfobacteriota bacterium]